MARVQTGYLVVADIAGYTSFMAKTELVHAQEVISELLNCVADQLTPSLHLAEVEGDALFVYVPQSQLARGETLLELIEAAYVAFRDRLASMRRNTTCACRACQAAGQLDLKFVTHFGQYVEQHVAGRHKPAGSDVNLIHRLLKNHVADRTGWRAYALFTAAALSHMEVCPGAMHESREGYDYLGDVTTYSLDLQSRYEALLEKRRIVLTAEEAQAAFSQDIAAPPSVVWDWLHDPMKRNRWMAGTHWSLGARANGRSGPGAESHCAHGSRVAVERILDWRPFEYFASEAVDGPITIRCTNQLLPIREGTRLTGRYQLRVPLPRWLVRPLGRLFFTWIAKIGLQWENLAGLIRESTKRVEGKPPPPSLGCQLIASPLH